MGAQRWAEDGLRVAVLADGGLRTVRDWVDAVERAMARARRGVVDALVLEFSAAGFAPSAREASMLVAALVRASGDRPVPVAVMARCEALRGARVLCMMGELRGCVAAAFDEEPVAWDWLRATVAALAADEPPALMRSSA
jgi:hypothetical protein